MQGRHVVPAAAVVLCLTWGPCAILAFVRPLIHRDVNVGLRFSSQHESVTESATTAPGVRVSRSGLSPDLQWITDPWDRGVLFSVKVDSIVHDARSKFQRIQVRTAERYSADHSDCACKDMYVQQVTDHQQWDHAIAIRLLLCTVIFGSHKRNSLERGDVTLGYFFLRPKSVLLGPAVALDDENIDRDS